MAYLLSSPSPNYVEAENMRRRLLSLSVSIKMAWPQGGRFSKKGSLPTALRDSIVDIVRSLPSPLPTNAGEVPIAMYSSSDPDLLTTVGRAVDTALLLLADDQLERLYSRSVTVIDHGSDGSPEIHTLGAPSVGELVTRIMAGLSEISTVLSRRSA